MNNDNLTLSERFWHQSALLPALISLLGGILCSGLVAYQINLFIVFILCLFVTLAVFATIGNALVSEKRRSQRPLHEVLTVCQAALAGDYTARLQAPPGNKVQHDATILPFIKTINTLLDAYSYTQKSLQARDQELAKLYDQMEQLVYEIKPIMDGDLRARSSIVEGSPGRIAAICNALIEDTAQLVRWTQYMSSQIIQTTHRLMGHSVDIAQVVEDLVKQHTSTTGTIESLLAFTQRMESAVFSNVEVFQENWAYLQQSQPLLNGSMLAPTSSTALHSQAINALSELQVDMPRQVGLMENLLQSVHETVGSTEITLEGLYSFEKRFYHINGIVAQFANMISTLSTLATNWRQAAENYALPSPQGSNTHLVEADTILPASS